MISLFYVLNDYGICNCDFIFVGMIKVEQDEILELFKEGNYKVIIVILVVEEGLDIQKCSLVVRYDYVINEIVMVQLRGN